MSSQSNNPEYLKKIQYGTSKNLSARANLHARYSQAKIRWTDWMFNQLVDLPQNANILEVGAGYGALWRSNASRIPKDWNIALTDFSKGMLGEARENLRNLRVVITYKEVDIQDIPFDSACFDAVIANHVLYHVADIARGVNEIRRVLKDNGKLFAATNGENHLKELYDFIFPYHPDFKPGFKSFTLENGESLLKSHFSKIELRHYEDELRVREARPIVDYIRSMTGIQNIREEFIPDIESDIYRRFESCSSLRITKASGVFVATC